MKTILRILFALAVCAIYACRKDGVNNSNSKILTGKWQLSETYFSAGGPGEWHKVNDKNAYIQFNLDGKVEGNVYKDFVSYALTDSVTITFTKQDNTLYKYRYTLKDGNLLMSPAGPIYCVEGCSDKFVKIGD